MENSLLPKRMMNLCLYLHQHWTEEEWYQGVGVDRFSVSRFLTQPKRWRWYVVLTFRRKFDWMMPPPDDSSFFIQHMMEREELQHAHVLNEKNYNESSEDHDIIFDIFRNYPHFINVKQIQRFLFRFKLQCRSLFMWKYVYGRNSTISSLGLSLLHPNNIVTYLIETLHIVKEFGQFRCDYYKIEMIDFIERMIQYCVVLKWRKLCQWKKCLKLTTLAAVECETVLNYLN